MTNFSKIAEQSSKCHKGVVIHEFGGKGGLGVCL